VATDARCGLLQFRFDPLQLMDRPGASRGAARGPAFCSSEKLTVNASIAPTNNAANVAAKGLFISTDLSLFSPLPMPAGGVVA